MDFLMPEQSIQMIQGREPSTNAGQHPKRNNQWFNLL